MFYWHSRKQSFPLSLHCTHERCKLKLFYIHNLVLDKTDPWEGNFYFSICIDLNLCLKDIMSFYQRSFLSLKFLNIMHDNTSNCVAHWQRNNKIMKKSDGWGFDYTTFHSCITIIPILISVTMIQSSYSQCNFLCCMMLWLYSSTALWRQVLQ